MAMSGKRRTSDLDITGLHSPAATRLIVLYVIICAVG